ncbi:hypothetical protein I7I48_09182 [Histoplasma ohiense]|nr:hypothetical protein I7I48_09182 [Histoplasma ohiense (nom. inval.)]
MTHISARDGIFHSNSATRVHHNDVNMLLSILCSLSFIWRERLQFPKSPCDDATKQPFMMMIALN